MNYANVSDTQSYHLGPPADVSTSRLHEVSRHRRFINFGVMGSYLHVNTEHPRPSRQLSSNGLQEQCRF
jgi:hypothetical protein